MKTDAEAVELQLATNLERRSHQALAHSFPEVGHLFAIVSIAQREHRTSVHKRLELVVEVAAHTLRRAVGVEHLRVLGLKVLQFVHQEVELLVGNDRIVLHIVAVVMLVQLVSQLQYARFFVHQK